MTRQLLGMGRLGKKPADGCRVDLEQACGVRRRLVTLRYHLANLGLLLRRQLGAASADSAFLPSQVQSNFGSFFEHGPFEFRERPHHLHHHPPCRRRRIDGFGQTAESRLGFPEAFHDGEHVAKGTRQPVEFPDHEDIALTKVIQELVKFRPVPSSTGGLLAIDALTSGRLERGHLGGSVLVIGGDASIADLHCSNVSPLLIPVQYLFATDKPAKSLENGVGPVLLHNRPFAHPPFCVGPLVRRLGAYRLANDKEGVVNLAQHARLSGKGGLKAARTPLRIRNPWRRLPLSGLRAVQAKRLDMLIERIKKQTHLGWREPLSGQEYRAVETRESDVVATISKRPWRDLRWSLKVVVDREF